MFIRRINDAEMEKSHQCRAPFPVRLTAFLDILGFKSQVKRLECGDADADLERTLSVLGFLRDQLGDDGAYGGDDLIVYEQSEDGKLRAREIGDLRMLYVSDSLIISAEDSENGLKALCYRISKIQTDLAADGFFVRGAIARGPLFHDGRIIFGSSYIHAYELEKKAIMPRIIFSECVVERYSGAFPLTAREVSRDAEYTYLRPFPRSIYPPYIFDWASFLLRVRARLREQLEVVEDPSVTRKLRWLEAEWLATVKEYRRMLPPEVL